MADTPTKDTEALDLEEQTGFRPIDDDAKTGDVVLIRHGREAPIEAAYWNMSPKAVGKDLRYPWTALDPTNGLNGWQDGKYGPTEYMPLDDVATLTERLSRTETQLKHAVEARDELAVKVGTLALHDMQSRTRIAKLQAALRQHATYDDFDYPADAPIYADTFCRLCDASVSRDGMTGHKPDCLLSASPPPSQPQAAAPEADSQQPRTCKTCRHWSWDEGCSHPSLCSRVGYGTKVLLWEARDSTGRQHSKDQDKTCATCVYGPNNTEDNSCFFDGNLCRDQSGWTPRDKYGRQPGKTEEGK